MDRISDDKVENIVAVEDAVTRACFPLPNLDLQTADGPTRVFTLLHDARPVLLNLGKPAGLDITPWAHRVLAIDATYACNWQLPVLDYVAARAAVLIRPDGYVAWVERTPILDRASR